MCKKLYDVCISGGGIGGIALALRLRMMNKNMKIFLAEKDKHFNQRSQGYGLTLQQAGTILNKLNIREKIQNIDTPNDAHYCYNAKGDLISCFGRFMFDKKGAESKDHTKSNKKKRYNFHLPRQKLREILLEELESNDKNILHWDRMTIDYQVIEWVKNNSS